MANKNSKLNNTVISELSTSSALIEQLHKDLLDNLPCGAALFEFNGGNLSIIHRNKRYFELIGRIENEYDASNALRFVHSDDMTVLRLEFDSALREKRDMICDIRLLCESGEYSLFHTVCRIREKSAAHYFIYVAISTISEAELSIQEMFPLALSAVMEFQTEYSFIKDRNLRYICSTRELAKFSGFDSPSDMIGKTDSELFESQFAEEFYSSDMQIINGGEPIVDKEFRVPAADGNYLFSRTSKFPLKDARGNVVGIYGIGYDITATRNMETRFSLLANSIPCGIASYEYRDGEYRIVYFNDGFCRLFNVEREEFTQMSAKHTFVGVFRADRPILFQQLDMLVKYDIQADCVCRVHMKDGGFKWINLKASSFERSDDKMVFNAVLLDVTERQTATERLRISEEEARLAIQHTRNAVCRYDVATGTLTLPEKTPEFFSLSGRIKHVPESTVEQGDISPETLDAYISFYDDIRNGEKNGVSTFQRRFDKRWRWLEAHFSTIFSDSGAPVSAVISYEDITERLEKDSAYKRWRQSFLSKAIESFTLLRCNLKSKVFLGLSEGTLLNLNFNTDSAVLDEFTAKYLDKYVDDNDRERFSAFLNADALLSGYYQGKRIASLEYREKLPSGNERWLRLTVDLVEISLSADIEAYMLFENIDKSKRHELAIIEKAETDPLTGVMNRAAFAAKVNERIQMSRPNARHTMMLLDLDGFKMVNDAFGHGAGDQSLIDLAALLRSVLRRDDLLGRLGGDEFVIFLPDIPSDVVAVSKARQICALSRKTFNSEISISGSIGIAVTPRDGSDFETLYKKSDVALYCVKDSGKDNFAFYYDGMDKGNFIPESKPAKDMTSALNKGKHRILVVDDNSVDLTLLSNLFSRDYITEKAKDGASALTSLRRYGSSISVVLLDLIMPGTDGFEVLKKMRETAGLRDIPVIVVTGEDNRETCLRAIREGASDFVAKPIDPELLRFRVEVAINRGESLRMRMESRYLESLDDQSAHLKLALEHNSIVTVENNWIDGSFIFDPHISQYISGVFDERSLWQILLSANAADSKTVEAMQMLVICVATDAKRSAERLSVLLKSPSGELHRFEMTAYKQPSAEHSASKVYISFLDLGPASDAAK